MHEQPPPSGEAVVAPQPPPHQERLAFHRQFRGSPNYRWWKPLVFALLAIVFGFTLTFMVSLAVMIPTLLTGDLQTLIDLEESLLSLDTQVPLTLFVALASLAVWIPSIIFAAWALGIKPLGRLWSVEHRVRWKLLLRTLLPALLSLVIMNAISIGGAILFLEPSDEPVATPEIDPTLALVSLGIILVLVPLQATAEELMFRGALMQILGSWIKNPIVPLALPTLLFALAHIYDIWGLAHVALLGLVAAWLTWRTGGLEAAISIHVVNNYVAFSVLLTGITGSTEQGTDTGSGPFSLVALAVSLAVYAILAVRIFEKGGWQRYSVEPALGGRPAVIPQS